jgi:hypothetical protein
MYMRRTGSGTTPLTTPLAAKPGSATSATRDHRAAALAERVRGMPTATSQSSGSSYNGTGLRVLLTCRECERDPTRGLTSRRCPPRAVDALAALSAAHDTGRSLSRMLKLASVGDSERA